MEKWLLLSIWIAVFGFLKEFRPEDPYITQYLMNPPMNFTNEQVRFFRFVYYSDLYVQISI